MYKLEINKIWCNTRCPNVKNRDVVKILMSDMYLVRQPTYIYQTRGVYSSSFPTPLGGGWWEFIKSFGEEFQVVKRGR